MHRTSQGQRQIKLAARSILTLRDGSDSVVPSDLLDTPAWDIILTVFCDSGVDYACGLQKLIRVSRMSLDATCSLLDRMENAALIERIGSQEAQGYRLSRSTEANLSRYLAGMIGRSLVPVTHWERTQLGLQLHNRSVSKAF